MKKEWDLSYLGQITAEQMMGLCLLYDQDVSGQQNKLSIPDLLSAFAIEGVDVSIVLHHFIKQGHAAHIEDFGTIRALIVSKDKLPADLLQQKEELKKRKREIQRQHPVNIEHKKQVLTELHELEQKINSLPSFFHIWGAVPVEEE